MCSGQSYWKTSATAPVVTECPVLTVPEPVVDLTSERHTCDSRVDKPQDRVGFIEQVSSDG